MATHRWTRGAPTKESVTKVPESVTDAETPAPKAASVVAAQIRKQIVMGELAEGDALPSEAEMVKRLGVSRPTLRQAFRILETEHLIAVQRGSRGGGTVFRPSPKLASRYLSDLLRFRATTIGDVLAARLMIEPAAVAQLARRRDEHAIAELRALLDSEQSFGDDQDGTTPADAFHVRMVELAGNPVLAEYCMLIHYLIGGHLKALRSTRRDPDPTDGHDATDAHAELVDLVAAGAVHAATEHWRKHLDDLHSALAKRLDLDAFLQPPE
jgi:GntR family transcriptional regulator, transcriptional repressor for pyruvate dehydrogenase complex